MYQIDALGKPCPQPVLLARQAADRGEKRFEILVDNEGAAQNVLRFIRNAGYTGDIAGEAPVWTVRALREGGGPFRKAATAAAVAAVANPGTVLRTLVIQGEQLGTGDRELGRQILTQLLNTLAVNDRRPEQIVLMNTGAKLACAGSPLVEPLRDLEAKGVSVLVCGTCLNHFDLNNQLEVGRPTDAYEVLNLMLDAGVVTWG